MAVIKYERVLDGTEISGKFGESLQITEKWQIRTDSPLTNKVEILNIVSTGGVYWGSPHWEFPGCKAMEFSCSPTGKDGMLWHLTVKFYVPAREPQPNGIPEDLWEAVGGVTTVPAFRDADDEMILNSAGDPLEGLEKERDERGWVLTRCYEDESWKADRDTYAGTVNAATWDGGDPKTWKCDFKGATLKSVSKFDGDDDGGKLNYVETRWEFRYEPQTWKCMPWDVGFMEKVNTERKTILGSDGKAVKQPVALNSDGTKRSPGAAPSVIREGLGADIYKTADFTNGFGAPRLMPQPPEE